MQIWFSNSDARASNSGSGLRLTALAALSLIACSADNATGAPAQAGSHASAPSMHADADSDDNADSASAGAPARQQTQTGHVSTSGGGAAGMTNTGKGAGGSGDAAGADAGGNGGSGGAVGMSVASAAGAGGAGTSGAAGNSAAAAPMMNAAPTAPTVVKLDCSRPGLTALVDAFFKALEAHDASTLPLAPSVKVTQDAKPIKVGEGLWTTAGKLTGHRNALDSERCGTVTMAVLGSQDSPQVVGARLRLEDQQISEIELFTELSYLTYLGAPTELADSTAGNWGDPLAADQRSSRADLEAIVNAYYDSAADPTKTPAHDPACVSLLDGRKQTTGCDSIIVPANPIITVGQSSMRRFPVADLEAGIAVGFGLEIATSPSIGFVMLKVVSGKVQVISKFFGQEATSWGWE